MTLPLETLVAFLVDERITYEWSSGNRNTIRSIANIVDPANQRPALDDIFLDDIVGMYPRFKRTDFSADISDLVTYLSALTKTTWFPTDFNQPLTGPASTTGVPYANNTGAVFFSRSVTYIHGTTGASVTEPAATALMGPFLGYSGPLDVSHGHTTFTRSYTLYYLLPSNGALLDYPDFDPFHPSAWVALSTYNTGEQLFPPTATGVEMMTITTDFALGGGLPWEPLSTYDSVGAETTAQLMARRSAEKQIMRRPQFQLALNQVLNVDSMFLVANLHSMALTKEYFPGIMDAFTTTKIAIADLLNAINRSEQQPAPVRPTVATRINAEQATGGKSNFDSLMREIMLKVLRETPIAILKGLVELIDPHVALSKFIKDITGEAFNVAGTAIDTGLSTLPDDNPLAVAGVTSNDVLGLAFCGLNILNAQASAAALPITVSPSDLAEAGPLLGPQFTLEGIDFTGSVSGMFMAPPSPFGIIYLLLMMLLNQEIPIDDEGEGQPEVGFADETDPDVC